MSGLYGEIHADDKAIIDSGDYPKQGDRFRHYKGGTYEIICTAKNTDSGRVEVIYRNLQHGTYWSRDLIEFMGTVPSEAPRFAREYREQG